MAENVKRCAIYTRKSTEDGLEQEFNSLDAQYEACAAYAVSQRHEGWETIERRYDDGGYSGGNMDRPGLKRLLEDVEAGLIDIILLYKIDRLTRSLADFSRIVDVLDKANASFVSITQAFNTTTSMGRLTLNMLLSFAQFEREVTGERIRDKIAASKKKGLWMGGPVPLGYRVRERKLVPVAKEAEQVRQIMERYLALGSVPSLVDELAREGCRTKVQKRASGPHKGGCQYRRGTLYHLLSNPIYRGKLKHKGDVFEGEHEPIVSQELWDSVQKQLKANASGSSRRKNASQPSLLTGILEDEFGRPMTPSHSGKSSKSRRYRYYVTRPDKTGDHPACRVSANDLEAIVLESIAEHLRADALLADLAAHCGGDGPSIGDIQRLAHKAAKELMGGPVEVKSGLARDLIKRATLSQSNVVVRLSRGGLARHLPVPERAFSKKHLLIETPAVRIRQGHQLNLVVPSEAKPQALPLKPDEKLIALVAEAFEARELVLANPTQSMSVLAKREGRCRTRLTKLVSLSCLAPDIIEAIVDGRQPSSLSAARLLGQPLSPCWVEQRTRLGFAACDFGDAANLRVD